jgi:hypothetical protein
MITRNVGFALGFAAFLILVSLAAVLADRQGWIGTGMPDRIVGVLIGLTVAVFSNPAAKRLPGAGDGEARTAAHAAFRRFFALTLVLAGIGYSTVWLFAPVALAPWIAVGVMLAGFVIIGLRGVLGGARAPRG